MRDIIRIEQLNFNYKRETVFSNFSMSIKEGSFITIAGANKSGKSTLIKLMAGLLPTNNSIILGYSYIDNQKIEDSARQVGVVLADLEIQFLYDNVYQELCFPLENLNYTVEEIEKRVIEVSKMLHIEPLLDKKTENLTTTEKKKICFALAILHKPKILLLDNPFSILTEKDRLTFLSLLKKLNQEDHITIVLATSNLTDALNSDYLYILNKGMIAIEGKPLVVMKEDKLLNQLGLELPFMVDLSLKLQFYDLIDEIIIDLERMVNRLWK